MTETIPRPRREIWSFFSGAMGLDLGLETAGLAPTLCVELDPFCCATIRTNRPNVTLLQADVSQLSESDLRAARKHRGGVFLVVGGPPCQSFSSGGKRAALSDPRGNLVYEYLRLVRAVRPKYFILENVANIVTAALRHRRIVDRPGKQWSLKRYSANGEGPFNLDPDELSGTAIRHVLADVRTCGYSVKFGVVDAADYGAPQRRLRFVMLGSRDGAAPLLPERTHGPGLIPVMTVRDAIEDLQVDPGPHSDYTMRMRRLFDRVPPGGNWRSLPPGVQRLALGGAWASGGGKTGFFRRLSWDEPSPTLTGKANRKASAICHPAESRPLSVRECARIQGFPDSWEFAGAMNRQYLQVGNAVPVHLGAALGGAIAGASYHRLAPVDVEAMLEAAVRRLRASARNKAARATPATEAVAG